MLAALYIRVSTLEQAIKGYSLPAQEEKLRGYAKYQGYDVLDVFCDDGYSGKDLNRPAISQVINLVKAKKIDVVIIYRLDRISRSVRDVISIVDLFIEKGVKLFSLNDNIDLTTPMGRATLKMAATWSELERETIIERTTMGKRQRALSGKLMSPGASLFGYVHDKSKQCFYVNEEEATIVRDVFDKYIAGMPLRALNDYCAEKYKHPYFSNAMSCKSILHRITYTGYYAYAGELVKGINYEPIISLETYYKAKDKLKEKRTMRTKETTPYLLTGLIYCAQCGARFYGKTRKHFKKVGGEKILYHEYQSYGCGTRIKPEKGSNLHCNNNIYDRKELDEFVINSLKSLRFTDIKSACVATNTADMYINNNIDIKKQKDKLLDLFLDGAIDKNVFEERARKFDKKIEENTRVLTSFEDSLTEAQMTVQELQKLIDTFDDLSQNMQRKLLGAVIDKIIIDNELVAIKWKVK